MCTCGRVAMTFGGIDLLLEEAIDCLVLID